MIIPFIKQVIEWRKGKKKHWPPIPNLRGSTPESGGDRAGAAGLVTSYIAAATRAKVTLIESTKWGEIA